MSSLHSTSIDTVSIARQRWLSSATRAFSGGQATHSGSGSRAAGVDGRAGCWGRVVVRADRHRKLLDELRHGLAARAGLVVQQQRPGSRSLHAGEQRSEPSARPGCHAELVGRWMERACVYLCGCFLNAAAEFCVVGSTGSCFSVATSATALGGAGALTPVLGRAATPTHTSVESSWRRPRSCRITAGAATDGGSRGMLQRRESTALQLKNWPGHDLYTGINYIHTPVLVQNADACNFH